MRNNDDFNKFISGEVMNLPEYAQDELLIFNVGEDYIGDFDNLKQIRQCICDQLKTENVLVLPYDVNLNTFAFEELHDIKVKDEEKKKHEDKLNNIKIGLNNHYRIKHSDIYYDKDIIDAIKDSKTKEENAKIIDVQNEFSEYLIKSLNNSRYGTISNELDLELFRYFHKISDSSDEALKTFNRYIYDKIYNITNILGKPVENFVEQESYEKLHDIVWKLINDSLTKNQVLKDYDFKIKNINVNVINGRHIWGEIIIHYKTSHDYVNVYFDTGDLCGRNAVPSYKQVRSDYGLRSNCIFVDEFDLGRKEDNK